jgi:hypothetical protein
MDAHNVNTSNGRVHTWRTDSLSTFCGLECASLDGPNVRLLPAWECTDAVTECPECLRSLFAWYLTVQLGRR